MNTQKPLKVLRTSGTLFVHSIFETIQGEGPYSGRRALFIRLAGCNLQCPSCFVSNTNIKMGDGSTKKISKIEKNDIVMSYNEETNLFEKKTVINTMYSETMDIYRVYTGALPVGNGGNSSDLLYCTGNHPFLVKNKGWVIAKNLKLNDVLLHYPNSERMKFNNPMFNSDTVNKVSATLRRGYLSGRIQQHSMSKEAKLRSSNRMKTNNPMKDPAVAIKGFLNRKDRGKKTSTEREFEVMCSGLAIEFVGDGSLIVDNKVPDFKVHGQTKVIEVWDATAPFAKSRNSAYIAKRTAHFEKQGFKCLCVPMLPKQNYRKLVSEFINNGHMVTSVEKIEIGSKAWVALTKSKNNSCTVYNFEVDGNHTYIANGKIVHNCDTIYTNGDGSISVATLLEDTLLKWPKGRLIVITGGEPFRQNIAVFANLLALHGYLVQIETNGSLPIQGFLSNDIKIVCSPKTDLIDQRLAERANVFKYVIEADQVDSHDGLPITALGHSVKNRVARPPKNWNGVIYIQPMDSKNEETNRRNIEACVRICTTYGHTLQLQIHKYLGVQ